MVLSKSVFDLDHSNNPVITLEVKSSPDVRDKIAKRFIETLGGASRWCEILPTGDYGWIIYPLTADQLRKHAEYMIATADEIDSATKKYGAIVEG